MKTLFVLTCLMLSISLHAQTNYITLEPDNCPNCLAATELIENENNIYVLREGYRIDSASLRQKYTFLRTDSLVFSNALFNCYAIDGMLTISNEAATLKCQLPRFNRKAHAYFSQWNSSKTQDTMKYTYPLSKLSIRKRIFTGSGKVYLLNTADNNVIICDLLHDKTEDTIALNEQVKRDAYTLFSVGNKDGYTYYKDAIEGHIPDSLCTIKDIAVDGDTLYLSMSNYFFYVGGKNMDDTFLTHFQSISAYKNGEYLKTYVPTNILQRLLDTSVKFYSGTTGLYKYNNNIYTGIYNTRYHEDGVNYVVGRYDPANNKLAWVSKLSEEFGGRYDFSDPIYSMGYYVLSKSPKLYRAETGDMIELAYFKQELHEEMGIAVFPKYYNMDINVDEHYYNMLYYCIPEKQIYYARIDRKTKEVLQTKLIPDVSGALKIDPYNNNYVIGFYDNDKIIRHKVFDEN